MAYVHFIFTLIAISSIFVAPALAEDFIVGDENGWSLNFDYQSWAMGKQFHVGDKLIFKYKQGYHNVYTVDVFGFMQCSAATSLSVPLTSGNDEVTLETPGSKYYICGVGKHCANGMKLFINVLPPVVSSSQDLTPAPAPAPWSYS